MNLIAAIKSGNPFRRMGQSEWKTKYFLQLTLRQSSADNFGILQQCPASEKNVIGVSLDDLLADDWEIQEPTITRTQFWEAYSNVMKDWQANHAYPVGAYAPVEVIVPALARKLGLEVI